MGGLLLDRVWIVLAGGGEEENPESAKSTHVEVEDGNAEECPADVACPDATEGQTRGCAVLAASVFGETVQLNAALARLVLGM